jgi:hypothetical protein
LRPKTFESRKKNKISLLRGWTREKNGKGRVLNLAFHPHRGISHSMLLERTGHGAELGRSCWLEGFQVLSKRR